MHFRAAIHCSDLVVCLNDYGQAPWRRLEGPYCLHKVRVLRSPWKSPLNGEAVSAQQVFMLYMSSRLICTTEQVSYERELQTSTVMSFSQVLVLGMESPSRCELSTGSDGGLDCSDLLSWENEVLFWESGLSSFALDANSLRIHGLFGWNKCLDVHVVSSLKAFESLGSLREIYELSNQTVNRSISWQEIGNLLVFFVLCHCRLNIFGVLSVMLTKHKIWKCYLALEDDIFEQLIGSLVQPVSLPLNSWAHTLF